MSVTHYADDVGTDIFPPQTKKIKENQRKILAAHRSHELGFVPICKTGAIRVSVVRTFGLKAAVPSVMLG